MTGSLALLQDAMTLSLVSLTGPLLLEAIDVLDQISTMQLLGIMTLAPFTTPPICHAIPQFCSLTRRISLTFGTSSIS